MDSDNPLTGNVSIEAGRVEDSYTAYRVFHLAIADMLRRTGLSTQPSAEVLVKIDVEWQRDKALMEHLSATADQFLLAKVNGQVVGYARAALRNGTQELTDFFVLPGEQSAGVGKALLTQAFPNVQAKRRVIIATTDVRALVRYLKAGVYARFPIYNFSREPRQLRVPGSLQYEPLTGTNQDFKALRKIDQAILEYIRDEEHRFFMSQRQGFLYRRGSKVVGYGYAGFDSGPIALLDESLYPSVLAHAESVASQSQSRIHFEVPLINSEAVDYLLSNGYTMSDFTALFMSNVPFGRFENYIPPAPPFIL